MTKKRQLPQWLTALLGLLLLVLLIFALLVGPEEQPPGPAAAGPNLPAEGRVPAPIPELAPGTGKEEEPEPLLLPPEPVADRGIGLILDDVGFDLHALERILNLPVPVAIAVLPGAPFARQSAMMAHRRGHVVMLHLPMEPQTSKYRETMTDTFLRADMSGDELRQLFLQNLEKVPYAEGVNNHMGSQLTELPAPMSQVMQICREKGLFFIDSKTSSRSVASELASSMDVAWASRSFFLDHSSDEAAMARAWGDARECARRGYRCIVIAHPHAETLSFLENHLGRDDLGLVRPLKQLLQTRSLQAGKRAGSLQRTL